MSFGKYTLARRVALLAILSLFFLQLLRLKILIGGLTGSLIFHWINLLDIFAFAESILSSRSFSLAAFYSAVPILILYLLLGRVFCGWVCPLDLVFRGMDRIKSRGERPVAPTIRAGTPLRDKIVPPPKGSPSSAWIAYLAALGFLTLAFLNQIPFFTSHLSPITNFYRSVYSGFFLAGGFPAEIPVFLVSVLILLGFLFLEFLWPRLWCRALCPVGKTYGLFNRVSLLHLRFAAGECLNCRDCEDVCYMGVKILSPIGREKVRDSSCILCGRCVEACDSHGKILKMGFGR